jgi:pre-mRNA cleavage complex 2 protein Pcf11
MENCIYPIVAPFHMTLSLTFSQTAPLKKLPAFYVLDSVVKNVGTPYTLFFGRNLYSTFMEAYVLVDNNIRRKMEEMLKTWKEPVPGSIDTRPVFPVEVTRPIENALIKARTSALQAHQEYARSQQQPMGRGRPGMAPDPYRNTPTPPNAFRPPPYVQQGYGSTYGQPYPADQVGQPFSQQQYGTPQVCRFHQSHSDITFTNLLTATRESAICSTTVGSSFMAAATAGIWGS